VEGWQFGFDAPSKWALPAIGRESSAAEVT
jgi:hypothetical protein